MARSHGVAPLVRFLPAGDNGGRARRAQADSQSRREIMPGHPNEEKLSLSTAILSNIALDLLLWILALRAALLLFRFADGTLL
jgi:hypothetical protein